MNISIRWRIALDVLDAALDCGDDFVAGACRRCIAAWRLGRKADPFDAQVVREFSDMVTVGINHAVAEYEAEHGAI